MVSDTLGVVVVINRVSGVGVSVGVPGSIVAVSAGSGSEVEVSVGKGAVVTSGVFVLVSSAGRVDVGEGISNKVGEAVGTKVSVGM